MNTPQLTDKQVKAALWGGGIPPRYHMKTYTLDDLDVYKASSDELKQWIRSVAAVGSSRSALDPDQKQVLGQLFLQGEYSLESTYLLARGLILSGIGAYVLSLPDVYSRRTDPTIVDGINNALVVCVTGMTDTGVPISGDEKHQYAVQWWLQKLQDSGKILVYQGETMIKDSPWWGDSFKRQATKNFRTLGMYNTQRSRRQSPQEGCITY